MLWFACDTCDFDTCCTPFGALESRGSESCGNEVREAMPPQVRNYKRFKPLEVQSRGLPAGYQDVRPGDCVVAFTRRHIYDIKHRIEIATGYRRACSHAACSRVSPWAVQRLETSVEDQRR